MYFCTTNVKLMFFKGIKKKSAQKTLDKALNNASNTTEGKIRTLGVLVDATVFADFPFVNEIAEVFGIEKNAIEIVYYHPNKKEAALMSELVYTDSELGFKGRIQNEGVTHFINKSYDGLLNYYNEDILLLNLVAVQSKAKFKMGFSGGYEGVNDFSVTTGLNNIEVFSFELKKYLSILNKI